jgi:hypothetical protein
MFPSHADSADDDCAQAPQQRPLQFLALGIAAYLLLWVAIFNGYPVVYPDTGEYLIDSLVLQPPVYRTIIYSLFIRLVSFGMTPWLVVLGQGVITIFMLCTVCDYLFQNRTASERRPVVFLGLVVFLAFGTSLPWFVGQLMPDVFTGVLFLSVFLLLYDSKLSLERTSLVSFVLSISVGCHLSHLVELTLLLVAILVLRAFEGARQFWPTRSTKGIIGFVLVPIMASAAVVALSNWHEEMGFTLSPGGHMFVLGRLVESGLVGDYLEKQCAIEQLTPCKYLHDLPRTADEFLWGSHPLLREMGGWLGSKKEANKIVFATIRHSPIRFLAECSKQTLRQFVSFKPGEGNSSFRSQSLFKVFQQLFPGDIPRYQLTKQWTGSLQKFAHRLTRLHTVVFWSCLGASLVVLGTRGVRARAANQLFVLTLIFLLSNALVTGALSTIHDRYQSRVSWLMGLCCAAYVVPVLLKRQNARSRAL